MGCQKLIYKSELGIYSSKKLKRRNGMYIYNYRYTFNGKETDNETGTQDYGMRIYNPALAKFLSLDPLSKKFPFYSPYSFAGNKPIIAIDLDGLEEKIVINNSYSLIYKGVDGKFHNRKLTEAEVKARGLPPMHIEKKWSELHPGEDNGPSGTGTLTIENNIAILPDKNAKVLSTRKEYEMSEGDKFNKHFDDAIGLVPAVVVYGSGNDGTMFSSSSRKLKPGQIAISFDMGSADNGELLDLLSLASPGRGKPIGSGNKTRPKAPEDTEASGLGHFDDAVNIKSDSTVYPKGSDSCVDDHAVDFKGRLNKDYHGDKIVPKKTTQKLPTNQ